MRFIIKVLLGLIIFNAMLIIFGPYFPAQTTGVNETAVDVSGTSRYNTLGNLGSSGTIISMILTGAGIFGATVLLGGLTSRLTGIKNFPTGMFMGAGIIISIVASLWVGLSAPLISITSSYPAIGAFYNVLVVCIGVVAVFSVAEIFTGKGDTD